LFAAKDCGKFNIDLLAFGDEVFDLVNVDIQSASSPFNHLQVRTATR